MRKRVTTSFLQWTTSPTIAASFTPHKPSPPRADWPLFDVIIVATNSTCTRPARLYAGGAGGSGGGSEGSGTTKGLMTSLPAIYMISQRQIQRIRVPSNHSHNDIYDGHNIHSSSVVYDDKEDKENTTSTPTTRKPTPSSSTTISTSHSSSSTTVVASSKSKAAKKRAYKKKKNEEKAAASSSSGVNSEHAPTKLDPSFEAESLLQAAHTIASTLLTESSATHPAPRNDIVVSDDDDDDDEVEDDGSDDDDDDDDYLFGVRRAPTPPPTRHPRQLRAGETKDNKQAAAKEDEPPTLEAVPDHYHPAASAICCHDRLFLFGGEHGYDANGKVTYFMLTSARWWHPRANYVDDITGAEVRQEQLQMKCNRLGAALVYSPLNKLIYIINGDSHGTCEVFDPLTLTFLPSSDPRVPTPTGQSETRYQQAFYVASLRGIMLISGCAKTSIATNFGYKKVSAAAAQRLPKSDMAWYWSIEHQQWITYQFELPIKCTINTINRNNLIVLDDTSSLESISSGSPALLITQHAQEGIYWVLPSGSIGLTKATTTTSSSSSSGSLSAVEAKHWLVVHTQRGQHRLPIAAAVPY